MHTYIKILPRTAIASLLLVVLTACTTTTYSRWTGDQVYKGTGGVCQQVDGIDVWKAGAPDRPYQIVGYILDERGAGIIPMASFTKDMVKVAKENGGDAIVIGESETSVLTTYKTMSYSSSTFNGTVTKTGPNTARLNGNVQTTGFGGTNVDIKKQTSKVFVLKYVK